MQGFRIALVATLLFACGPEEGASPPPADEAAPASVEESAATAEAAPGAPRSVYVPPDLPDVAWLETRAAEQAALAETWQTFHDFRFRDRRKESGITWRHQIVDDARVSHKSVHYDHGTAVVVADVDGDGHLDVYVVNQLGNNSLWRGRGDGSFEDITFQAGVQVFEKVCVGASFADTDNDGDPDLYVTTVKDGNVLFENDGKGIFRDATEGSGIGHRGHSSGPVFFDYDRDGLVDLFLTNVGVYTTDVRGPGRYWIGLKDAFGGHLKPERTEKNRLFRNLGGNRFEDVTEKVGLDDGRWSGDAHPFDRNGDGWPDIFVLNMQGLDGYWENVEGKRFVEKTEELFPHTSWGAMGIAVFDFENDGDMDIFTTDMHSDMAQVEEPTTAMEKRKAATEALFPQSWLADDGKAIYGNAFFRSNGDGSYQEVSDAIGAENFWPWGLSVDDVNADGFTDAFITSSMNYPFRYGINSLLLNDAGKGFLDAEFVLGLEPREGPHMVPWFEIDCAGEHKYHNDCPEDGTPGPTVVYGALGSRSSVIFDMDSDGDLDIVANEFNTEPLVFRSNLSEQKPVRFLKVSLEGTRSNRSGLGARVTVVAGGLEQVKVHDGKSGYLGQSDKPLYFGLGDATRVDAIRVQWPSGVEQTLSGPIEIGKTLVIEEPAK